MSGKERTVKLEEEHKFQNPMEMWTKFFQGWKGSESPFAIYAKSFEMFFAPNADQLSKLTEQWSKSWNLLGQHWPMKFNEMSPNQLSVPTFDSFKNVNEFWNNSWFGWGNQFLQTYFQAFQNFSEQMQKMWKPNTFSD